MIDTTFKFVMIGFAILLFIIAPIGALREHKRANRKNKTSRD